MNDMATREPRNRRGWQAQYQTRCDCCGRFTQPGAPGSSWVMVPHSDVSMGDERERCPACTEKLMYIMRDPRTGRFHEIRPCGVEHWSNTYELVATVEMVPVTRFSEGIEL